MQCSAKAGSWSETSIKEGVYGPIYLICLSACLFIGLVGVLLVCVVVDVVDFCCVLFVSFSSGIFCNITKNPFLIFTQSKFPTQSFNIKLRKHKSTPHKIPYALSNRSPFPSVFIFPCTGCMVPFPTICTSVALWYISGSRWPNV